MDPVISTSKPVQPELAITYSDRSRSFMLTEPINNQNYLQSMSDWHNMVCDTPIECDFIFEESDLTGYRIVMTPFMYHIPPAYLRRAVEFVTSGGIWIVGPLSGGRTAEHTIPTDCALGDLEEIAGVHTVYTYPMDGTQAVGRAFGTEAILGLWSAVFRVGEAEVVGVIEGGVTPGLAFITQRELGRGRVVLLGSMPQRESGKTMLQAMIGHYAGIASVSTRRWATAGTLAIERERHGARIWIVVTHNGAGGIVEFPGKGVDILGGGQVDAGRMEVGPYEYRVIEFAAAEKYSSQAMVHTQSM